MQKKKNIHLVIFQLSQIYLRKRFIASMYVQHKKKFNNLLRHFQKNNLQ